MNPPLLSLLPVTFTGLWFASSSAPAYPGPPAGWFDWQTRFESSVSPRRLAASTDPDGRLRLVCVNAADTVNGSAHPITVINYTRFPVGPPVDRMEVTRIPVDSSAVPFPQLSKPQRISLSTAIKPGGFVSSFYWSGSAEGKAWGMESQLLTWFPRPPFSGSAGFYNTVDSVAAGASHGIQQARVASNSSSGSLKTQVTIVLGTNPPRVVFQSIFPSTSWTQQRECTGAGMAMNPSFALSATRTGFDAYLALATVVPSGTAAGRELRLWRIGAEYTNASSGDLAVNIAEEVVVASAVHGGGFPGMDRQYVYPKVLVSSTGTPLWVVWSDLDSGRIHLGRRTFTGFPPANNSLGSSYEPPSSLGGFLAVGREPDAALDRLNRLHVVWREPGTPDFCWYARENADGTFSKIPIGECSGAPAVTVGPGEYPWIAYPGVKENGAPLTIRCPRGLMDFYQGDFEDKDSDGRPALLEKAMGHSDQSPNFLKPAIELTFADNHPRLAYQLHPDAVREGNSVRYNLMEGNDTITIEPSFSTQLQTWQTHGFTHLADITISGRGRILHIEDNGTLNLFPRQAYRLNVRRLLGPP